MLTKFSSKEKLSKKQLITVIGGTGNDGYNDGYNDDHELPKPYKPLRPTRPTGGGN